MIGVSFEFSVLSFELSRPTVVIQARVETHIWHQAVAIRKGGR